MVHKIGLSKDDYIKLFGGLNVFNSFEKSDTKMDGWNECLTMNCGP